MKRLLLAAAVLLASCGQIIQDEAIVGTWDVTEVRYGGEGGESRWMFAPSGVLTYVSGAMSFDAGSWELGVDVLTMTRDDVSREWAMEWQDADSLYLMVLSDPGGVLHLRRVP